MSGPRNIQLTAWKKQMPVVSRTGHLYWVAVEPSPHMHDGVPSGACTKECQPVFDKEMDWILGCLREGIMNSGADGAAP